jgi:hypothetical protein
VNGGTVIGAEQTRQIIEKAIRSQAQVVIELPAFGTASAIGFFVSGDNSALLVELSGRLPVNQSMLVNSACEVQFQAGGQYRFSSVITACPNWGETRALALSRPESLRSRERRRLLRATLAPSSVVNIECRRAGSIERHSAALLNISADGLACRVSGRGSSGILRNDAVCVSFRLPWHGQTFRIDAQVCNCTPCSNDNVIIGVQFEDSAAQSEQREALRQCLESRHETLSDVEACV